MWPFGRRQKDISTIPPIDPDAHRWGIAEGSYDNSPLLLRINATAKEWVGHKDLGIKLGFAVPLNSPDDGGLPTPEENYQLNDVEDAIVREVEAKTKGIFALVLTTGTMKEYVFYIPENVDIESIHKAIQSSVKTHEVQCIAVRDPDWSTYKQFARM
jgi:hypothetical protein